MYNESSVILLKSQRFAVRITKMVSYLQSNRKSNASTLNQILRSGTSILANVSESQYAQSRADFITKLHIALKEAHETKNWLLLIRADNGLTDIEYKSMIDDCNEILAILTASLNTAKKNMVVKK